MTIRKSRESQCMVAICDQCSDVVEFNDLDGSDYDDWAIARTRIDVDGWKTRKEGDKWINICCDCL